MPCEAELINFMPADKEESSDVEWHTGLFGERCKKKNQTVNNDETFEWGEGSSSMENSYEVPDLVFHGRGRFGIVIGREKGNCFRVLEEGTERPVVAEVKARLLKKANLDKKCNALDRHNKIISVNDTVRVLEGPLEDNGGIVKQIYKGVVFVHDENLNNSRGYFCAKARICEKIESSADSIKEKGGESEAAAVGGHSEPPPEVGCEGVHEGGSFAERLRNGAQELAGLMEEAATRCGGVEDELRVELRSCKERVSAVEAECDALRNSIKHEREKIIAFYRGVMDTEFDLVNRLKEESSKLADLRVWCARAQGCHDD